MFQGCGLEGSVVTEKGGAIWGLGPSAGGKLVGHN